MKKRKKGFTLIELIIVVAIIGILAAIAVPKFGEIQKNSKIKADVATAKQIADAATRLIAENEIGNLATDTPILSTTDADTTDSITDSAAGDIVAEIRGQLQAYPKSAYYKTGGDFYIIISGGNPIVKLIGAGIDGTRGTWVVYPQVEKSDTDGELGKNNPFAK